MAIFEYSALTSSGRLMTGTIEAASSGQASELLKEMQLSVNEIRQAKREELKTAIGRNEFILFNQQLAAIAKAGIPLERGLRELSVDIASRPMRKPRWRPMSHFWRGRRGTRAAICISAISRAIAF